MAIAGIEGLAQGLIQGMALKRQNDRQDVLDAQNLERFGMDKERFATQQAASAFELQNAQTNAANAAIDRKRNLGIQANQDAFDVKMKRLLSTGDDNLATLAEVEKVHHEDGVKGAFQRDPKTGVILTDEKGFATWINADGSPPQKHTGDSARKLFFAKQYPKDAMTREINNADTIAKEAREEKTTIAKEERAAKTAKEKDERDYQQALALENVRTANIIKAAKAKGTLKDPKDYMSKLSQQAFYDVQETIDPYTKAKTYSKPIFNQAKYNDFVLFAHKNDINPDDAAYRLWVSIGNQGQPQGQNTNETYKSSSQGDLVVTGLSTDAAQVNMSDKPPLVLGNQGAAQPVSGAPKGLTVNPSAASNQQSATPTEESIAKPVTKTQVVSKRQGRGVQMSAPKTIIYQEIQGKFGDPIPDGFKRKKAPFGTDVRTPEYNVFVSKNYDEYND